MKVLLFTGYGGYAATPQMRKILEKYDGIYSRIGEIVDYVENNHVLYHSSHFIEAESELKNNRELIIKFEDTQRYKDRQSYVVYDANLYGTASFSIVDVDTTRPWTIEEYDGAEYIQYLDENKLIDKELNYYDKC
jgi:hypothetical protein